MIGKLKEKFQSLEPEQQQKLTRLILVALLVVISLIAYYSNGHKQSTKNKTKKEHKIEDLQPKLGLLEKSLYYETTTRVKALEDRIDKLNLELKTLSTKMEEEKGKKEDIKALESQIQALKKELIELKGSARGRTSGRTGGMAGYRYPRAPGKGGKGKQGAAPQIRIIGGVGHEKVSLKKSTTPERKKSEKYERTVYLPPSFVQADLISGFAAPTMEAAKSEPVRVLLRIRDLAVLPNEVKSDIKGCFLIAEGYGNLADERAHLRLLRLSCIARDGSSVIDEKVKGFVVDEDGRIGLKGRVVAKMGALLGRSILAGFLKGFGSAYSESAFETYTTAAGEVRTLSPERAVSAGIGKGIKEGADSVAKFYLDMARQTFPVIEVGAGKRVTVVVEEGVDLRIRKKCLGGRDGCSEEESSLYAFRNL